VITQAMPLNHATLLALTPLQYLRLGWRDESGQVLPQLRSIFATAAAAQLEATETSPEELGATLIAFQQVLLLHQGTSSNRFKKARDEALETVARLYHQPNNRGIVTWLEQCGIAIQTDADLAAFIEHFTAVVRQYSAIIALLDQPLCCNLEEFLIA
jgi:hypothetical protein